MIKLWCNGTKYGCSYQQFAIGRKDGSSRSEQTRTPYSFSAKQNTPEEESRDKIAELERRNLDLQMENDLLKKSEN